MMRMGSKPECWKKRLSSAEVTACTSTGGMSRNFTKRRFSRLGPERLVMSCGSSWYCGRGVLSCSETMCGDPAAGKFDDAGFLLEIGIRCRGKSRWRRARSRNSRWGCCAIRYSRCGAAGWRYRREWRHRRRPPIRARRKSWRRWRRGRPAASRRTSGRTWSRSTRIAPAHKMTSSEKEAIRIRPKRPNRKRAARDVRGTRTFISRRLVLVGVLGTTFDSLMKQSTDSF